MARLIGAVSELFRNYPFLTNSAIYGSLYVGAEYTQQVFTKHMLSDASIHMSQQQEIDYATIGRYAIMGTTVYAPSLYIWYKWLDGKFPGTRKSIILKKLTLDQFVLTPYLLTVFYMGMSLMEGAEDPVLELQEKFFPTFARSCLFWLPAQTLNFSLIVPKFRVIYMGICGFIWVNILCWIKRQQVVPNDRAAVAVKHRVA